MTQGSDTTALDVVASSERSGGTITEDGATIKVILSGRTLYVEGSSASMTKLSGSQPAGQLLGGRWLQTTTDNQDFGDLSQLFDLRTLVQSIKPQGKVHKGAMTDIDGVSAIALTDSSGHGTLYVANAGPPYILAIDGTAGESGSITFDEYNTAKAPAVPTGAVNLDQLEQG